MTSRIPFFLPQGTVLIHRIYGRLLFVGHLGGWVLHFFRAGLEDEGPFQLLTDAGKLAMPTVDWVLKEFAAGDLYDPNEPAAIERREARFLGLDRAACIARDPKSAYRHDWGLAALKAGVPKSGDKIAAWLKTAVLERRSGDPEEFGKMLARKPVPRSLIRWMGKLEDGGLRIGACVNRSGREPGQSQLSDIEDRLVHKAALTYSADSRIASIDEAAALGTRWWHELKDQGEEGLADHPPTAETYRLRIRSLDCKTTMELRSGKHAASRFFDAKGEPVPATRPFERVFMDGTEYEHACIYSEDWPIPSNKVKGVSAMDACTSYVFPSVVFAGPYRAEMGIKAALNIMTPPVVTAEEIAADPFVAMIFSTPNDLVGDNDRTLIPPAIVPAAVTLLSSVQLAGVYRHNVKSRLEFYHKFVKRQLRGLRGRVLGPTRYPDPRYDPLTSSDVTRAQYAQMIEQARQKWNHAPRRRFGNKSPYQLMVEYISSVGARLIDPGEVRRHFASTPADKMLLTNNGLVYDQILYRWNPPGVEEILGNNHRKTPFAKRIEGSAKAYVTIRVYDGDLAMIEVLDETTGKYHAMWSTNPRYTAGLSRWEHAQYCAMLKAGKGGAISENARLALKAKSLIAFDQDMPNAEFRARANMVALMEAEEVRIASGARASKPDYASVPELGIPTIIAGEDRADTPRPPPQPPTKSAKRTPGAPKRAAGYGYGRGTAEPTEAEPTTLRVDTPKATETSFWDDDPEA